MQCPVDNTQLQMMDRQGVEIDYCPKCRGVWLDRGELDKLIERAAPPVALSEPARAEARREDRGEYRSEPPREYREDRGYREDDRYGHGKPYKKRKGFLSEIFDFD